jgi:hypothetical protein
LTPLGAIVLAWMLALQPAAVTPWTDTYEDTAEAIAEVATEAPLYRGPRGELRTAALLTSIASFESRFDPAAAGDHGASVCLMQIGVSNLRALGVRRAELLESARACLRAGVRMIQASFYVCRARAPEDRLAHYAAGGLVCGEKGTRESRHRSARAAWLVRLAPPDAQ